VAVAPEVLSKYAGVYKGFWGQRPRLVEATFIGGRLCVAVDGKEQLPLIPQSATLFTAGGYSYHSSGTPMARRRTWLRAM